MIENDSTGRTGREPAESEAYLRSPVTNGVPRDWQTGNAPQQQFMPPYNEAQMTPKRGKAKGSHFVRNTIVVCIAAGLAVFGLGYFGISWLDSRADSRTEDTGAPAFAVTAGKPSTAENGLPEPTATPSTSGAGGSHGADSTEHSDSVSLNRPASSTPSKEASAYILKNSSTAYLSAADLTGLDYQQLCLAQFEIFARHNCFFDVDWIQQYFNTCPWYKGTVSPVSFNEGVLNSFELSNLQLIHKQIEASTGYIMNDSATRYLSIYDLIGLTEEEACFARNEIFARHGRLFDVDWIQSYFNGCSWYRGYISAGSFSDSVLNPYEKQNIQTIKEYEKRFD